MTKSVVKKEEKIKMSKRKLKMSDDSSSSGDDIRKIDAEEKNKAHSKQRWNKVDGADPSHYMYEPAHFIRSHCRDNDPTDISTQIWDVVFEPSVDGTTSLVATCGGRFVCVFDVKDGSLLMKYKHKNEEDLLCLAWTTIRDMNILACGSASGELRLFHPANKVSFHSWRDFSGKPFHALCWHDTSPNWLIAATSDGHVTVWEVGGVTPPMYQRPSNTKLLKLHTTKGIYTMKWVSAPQWLLLGTDRGLVGWHLDKLGQSAVTKTGTPSKIKPTLVDFRLPGESQPYVDSVCCLGGDVVAVKCVVHGQVVVWGVGRGKESEQVEDERNIVRVVNVEVLAVYRWRQTDNFFMNLGSNTKSGLFACGDDEGGVWVYKLKESDNVQVEEDDQSTAGHKQPDHRLPIGRLPWPSLRDENLDPKRPPPNPKDIIIDKVDISSDDNYIVAVTNTNTVCIWHRSK